MSGTELDPSHQCNSSGGGTLRRFCSQLGISFASSGTYVLEKDDLQGYAATGVRQPHPTASWHSFPTKTLFIGILHILHIPVVAAAVEFHLPKGRTHRDGGIFLRTAV